MNLKKVFLTLAISAAALPILAISSRADKAQIQELVPEAERQRITDRTYIFSRSQLKYGLQRTNYLSRWVDQPLFVDPALSDGSENTMPPPVFKRMAEILKEYGLDGFAFFPQTSGRYLTYGNAEQANVPGFTLLNELASGWNWSHGEDETIKLALDSPKSLRVNGKLVFTSYRAESKSIDEWKKLISNLRQKHGDQFIFIPDVSSWAGVSMNTWRKKYHANKITKKDIEKIQSYLQEWLRATDGLYIASAAGFQNADHTFDDDAYRNFVIPIMKSVLAEPEFKNKYFGLSAVVGHENSTRNGLTLSSDATKTLRKSMEAVMSANPDIINIPEWDEQNENTSLRPTVYNGLSSMRILRYYTAKLRGEKLIPLPQDNQDIPDLIISYRKLLVVGEKLELELLNVPDSGDISPYAVRVTLKDRNGNVIKEFHEQEFEGSTLQDHTLIIPSEELSEHKVLLPSIEINYKGHKSTFEDGLHYIDLRSTWNWDYKWIKQSMRDQLSASKVLFEVGEKRPDNTRLATAEFSTDEPLARVQILDNDDVIYEYSSEDKWRETKNQITLSFEWYSLQTQTDRTNLKGSITLNGAAGKWSEIYNYGNTETKVKTTPTNLSFNGLYAYSRPQRIFLTIPREQVEDAMLEVNLEGIYQGKIPISTIMEKGLYGISGPYSFNLMISRYVRQNEMLPLLQKQKVTFSVPVQPDLPNSVLHLQAIGVSGRIYRSKPVVLSSGNDKKESITTFSHTKMALVQSNIQKGRVPDIRYQFDPQYGSVLMTDAGRSFWGVLGSAAGLATTRGGNDSTSFMTFSKTYISKEYKYDEMHRTAPTWEKLDNGEYALQFDGKGTYISLPQGAITRRAAITIETEIKPDTVEGKQIIIANRHHYPGALTVFIEDGVLKAEYRGQDLESDLTLPAKKWSHLIIRRDLENITFEVDGKMSKKLPAPGIGSYDTPTAVGGFGTDWFEGQIKSLRIRQGI